MSDERREDDEVPEEPEDLVSTSLFAGAAVVRPADNSQAWMVTFADLVALLLTFFVLLFAMSRVETRDWQNLADALSQSLNQVSKSRIAVPDVDLDLKRVQPVPGANLDYLGSVLRDQMTGDSVLSRAVLRRQEELLIISLPADLLFAPGAVEPAARASDALFGICGILRNLENRIEIAGHADPTPPGARWPSNWNLSLGRALSVAARLQDNCYRKDMVALGFGDARFADLPQDLPTAQRRALARRVDIIIHETAARK